MIIKNLQVSNYRNYSNCQISPDPGLNCFVGMNGMGKTNLLDALYFLCMSKSHISGQDRTVIKKGSDFTRLEGLFDRDGESDKIVVKIQTGEKKKIERNDVLYKRLSEHIGLLPVVVYSPKEISLVNEGSIERRRFLNNSLSQINKDYLKKLILYRKIINQRNALLHQFAEKRYFDQHLINSYDEQLLEPAEFLAKERAEFIKRFIPVFRSFYSKISNDAEEVDIRYRTKIEGDNFAQILRENLEKDRVLKRTSVGIHKDDLVFTINELSLKQYGSQGQVKSFILAIKLAQFQILKNQIKTKPIILFDDIFDKLDIYRASQLLSLIKEQEIGQVFLTDTDEERIRSIVERAGLNLRIFRIENGKIAAQSEEV